MSSDAKNWISFDAHCYFAGIDEQQGRASVKTQRQLKTSTSHETPVAGVVGVRFPPELLADLDAEVEKRKQVSPWTEITRVEIIREAVFKLLHPAPALAVVAPLKTAPIPKAAPAGKVVAKSATTAPNVLTGACLVCGGALPKSNKSLCGKPECKKEIHRRREKERRNLAKE